MTNAKQLLLEAIAKIEMARDLDPSIDEDLGCAVMFLRYLLTPVTPDASGLHPSKDKASESKGSGIKRKPRRKDEFNGRHSHD